MKTQAILLSLAVAAAGTGSAHAQDSRPNAVASGAILGGIAGAFIGGHNHDRWAQGTIIGAAAGALIGAAVDRPTRTVVRSAPAVCPPVAPVVYVEAPRCSPPRHVVYVEAPPPRVVYVRPAPRVVYVTAPAPRCDDTVVVVAPQPRRSYGRQIVYVEPSYRRW